jgi:uncharacterized protein
MRFGIMDVNEKLAKLESYLESLDSLAVAFSGGVDSSFLLKIAHTLLGDKVLAVIINSSTFPQRELEDALELVNDLEVNYRIIEAENINIEGFADNPRNRCYLCKRDLFSHVWPVARDNNIKWVADGSNFDDINDYRPGMMAIKELGVISPLLEAGLRKADIRALSKRMQLKSWDKPAAACLASRFSYGQRISLEKLKMVEAGEDFLLELGFKQVRVRVHENLARIEVDPAERHKFYNDKIMDQISDKFKELGFPYSSLDLAGYRTGSMNENID